MIVVILVQEWLKVLSTLIRIPCQELLKRLVTAMPKAASSRRDNNPVTEEIMEMMDTLERFKMTGPVSMKTLDDYPDEPIDMMDNPISKDSLVVAGKHKAERWTFEEMYHRDKGYVEWVRGHINKQSHHEMIKLKVFFAHVDAQKMNRLNQGVVPPKTQKTGRQTPKRGTVRTRAQEEEMEWEKVTDPSVNRWGDLSMKVVEKNHQEKKRIYTMMAKDTVGRQALQTLLS